MIIRNGFFSFRWTQILEAGGIAAASTVLKARRTTAEPVTVRAGADRRGHRHDSPRAARGGLRATRRDRLRHDRYCMRGGDAVVGGGLVLDCIARRDLVGMRDRCRRAAERAAKGLGATPVPGW